MENSMEVIYKLTSPSGKHYIGRTNDFDGRMANHKYNAKMGEDFPIHRAIRKYGWDNFIKEIVCECKSEDSINMESYYIEKYDSFKNGYNATLITDHGGDQWVGSRDSSEYEAWVKKMTEINGGSNNGMYGKNHKESTIEKMKSKAKGRFSKQWYIERNGLEEGIRLYDERCQFLKNRKLKRDSMGMYVKKENISKGREILRELTQSAQDMGLGYSSSSNADPQIILDQKVITDFRDKLEASQEHLDPEMASVLYDNLSELYATDDRPRELDFPDGIVSSMRSYAEKFCNEKDIRALPLRKRLDDFCVSGEWPQTYNELELELSADFEKWLVNNSPITIKEKE